MTPESSSSELQRYRFVVKSAEEAVSVLRERFGTAARVVSVRQVEGTGLARFLQSPKLEIIAEVTAGAAPAAAAPKAPEPAPAPAEALLSSISELEATPVRVTPPIAAPSPAPEPEEEAPNRTSGEPALTRLLQAAGISAQFIARMRSEPAWNGWENGMPRRALAQIGVWLQEKYGRTRHEPLGQRIAFLGSPGVGKTTALCKQLAHDVFCRQRRATVLKLDLDHANPSDALAVACEALGATFARDFSEVPSLGPDDVLYLDLPGITPTDEVQTDRLREALDPLFVTDRVLVANAAYEAALLKRAFQWGARMGCTRSVLTHADELAQWGKLWDFILDPRLVPLFLSTGQNVAGDLESDVVAAAIARSFPAAPTNPGAAYSVAA